MPVMRIETLRQRLRALGANPDHERRVLRLWSLAMPQASGKRRIEDFLPATLRAVLPALEAELAGLATVSYLLSGQMTHRDSLGHHQVIRPGEVNWMTAGRGITHSERFTHPDSFAGDGLELMQFWVALPEADEECDPAFTHYPAAVLPQGDTHGVWWRLLAGQAWDASAPVRTHSPLFALHARLSPAATLALPTGHREQGVYVAHGSLRHAGDNIGPGHLLVYTGEGDAVAAGDEGATLLVFGGEPLGERHIFWNFVSSRRERIEQAKADWRAGRFALPPDDHDEWIPLPG
jgi:redox-sensitive bicupin YhaK (pirin superfamily)